MIPVPESVLAYYTEFDVQTAIDLMSGAKDPKVPPNLRWEDVGNFYRARLAAVQLPIEYAIFLEALWHAAWCDLPAGWVASKPNDPLRPDLAIGITTVWTDRCFSRSFIRGDHQLELMVCLTETEGFQLGVTLYGEEDGNALPGELLAGWVQYPNIDAFWTEESVVPLAETIATEPFRRWTDQAWVAVTNVMSAA